MYIIFNYTYDYAMDIKGYVKTKEEAMKYIAINNDYEYEEIKEIQNVKTDFELEYIQNFTFVYKNKQWNEICSPSYKYYALGTLKDTTNNIVDTYINKKFGTAQVKIKVYQTKLDRKQAEKEAIKLLGEFNIEKKITEYEERREATCIKKKTKAKKCQAVGDYSLNETAEDRYNNLYRNNGLGGIALMRDKILKKDN